MKVGKVNVERREREWRVERERGERVEGGEVKRWSEVEWRSKMVEEV